MTTLDGTVAIEQMQDGAVRVREHLHFDVPRRRQIAFEQQPIVLERCGGAAASRSLALPPARSTSSTMCMPLPPPPPLGLMMSGKPSCFA